VLFIYRIAEYLSRIAVLCLGLIDLLHCHELGDPATMCPGRGCLMSNPACINNCECVYKVEILVVIIIEFLLLLIFLRVTATQDTQSSNAIENLQHHIKIWACSLCNMQVDLLLPLTLNLKPKIPTPAGFAACRGKQKQVDMLQSQVDLPVDLLLLSSALFQSN